MGLYFDQTLCVGCCTCVVACKDWHDVPAGPASYLRIATIEKGKYPDISVHHMFIPCYHCVEPACAPACPVGAITKRAEDGVVVVNRETCLGRDVCGTLCLDVCPYKAPQFAAEGNAKMQKCDYCLDRLAENQKPVCINACPMHALDAGPIEELRAKYGDIREAEGFVYSDGLMPCIVFKPKKDGRGLAVQKTVIAPSASS